MITEINSEEEYIQALERIEELKKTSYNQQSQRELMQLKTIAYVYERENYVRESGAPGWLLWLAFTQIPLICALPWILMTQAEKETRDIIIIVAIFEAIGLFGMIITRAIWKRSARFLKSFFEALPSPWTFFGTQLPALVLIAWWLGFDINATKYLVYAIAAGEVIGIGSFWLSRVLIWKGLDVDINSPLMFFCMTIGFIFDLGLFLGFMYLTASVSGVQEGLKQMLILGVLICSPVIIGTIYLGHRFYYRA
ncbi:MAG: hypothetical protein GY754_19095 [bacterium]|nr:hypothetical protein [bacterium]